MTQISLQEKFAPHNICFGCGPANSKGLKIRSFLNSDSPGENEEVLADWTPESHHEAFPGILNGGIIGALLDCHSNWTAAWHLMKKAEASHPPCTVTAEYSVKLFRPTPSRETLHLRARVKDVKGDRVIVEATLETLGKICASCRGTFVAVQPGHPAYHRW
jgi:acyl-coenzyme A thioesterase PaaI-like protein